MKLFNGKEFITVKEIEIPQDFLNSKTEKPFEKCSLCNKNIVSEEMYFIEKNYKKSLQTAKHELIFEYAMCFECRQNLASELSKESVQNLQMYFDLYTQNSKEPETDQEVKQKLSTCFVRKKNITEFNEYQKGAIFANNKMLLMNNSPIAMSSYAIEEIQELISEKTRDFLDGIKDKIMPPEIGNKIPDNRLIFV